MHSHSAPSSWFQSHLTSLQFYYICIQFIFFYICWYSLCLGSFQTFQVDTNHLFPFLLQDVSFQTPNNSYPLSILSTFHFTLVLCPSLYLSHFSHHLSLASSLSSSSNTPLLMCLNLTVYFSHSPDQSVPFLLQLNQSFFLTSIRVKERY